MSIMRWDPLADLARMRNEMDRMMSDALGSSSASGWLPAMDICDSGDTLLIRVDLPGMDRGDVDITTTENMIRIKGKTKREEHEDGISCYRHERMIGSFERTVTLPVRVRPDEARATFKDGMLEIRLPKAEAARKEERKVEIEKM